MIGIILVFIVCVALVLSIYTGIYALFRSQSCKKNSFLLMQVMIITYLVGYLLEITSITAEEAYTGVKVLYLGAYFVAPFSFFFVADYCNIKLHPVFVKTPMLVLSLASILAMWTTKLHGLVYVNYDLDTTVTRHLHFTPGPLYSVMHIIPTFCMILNLILLVYQIKIWKNKYRKQLIVFLLCVAIPFIAETLYYITIITDVNIYQIYLTPHSLALMSFFIYIGVMRFNIFEIISTATVTAMEHIKEGFVLVDESNNYLSSNYAAAKIIPGITELVNGQNIFAAKGWPQELHTIESDIIEFSITDNETSFFEASISPVFAEDREVKAKIILFREITDSVVLMKQLENAAYLDALTGLYNRKHFSELAVIDIERALRSNQSIYMVMLDLDFFKRVNDTYGHAAGDAVLKTTAGIIRQTIRSYDLLGRYGGEEFVLLITNLDEQEAYKLMERIRENMENNIIHYEENEINITCSIGLAKFEESDTLETSVKKADEALYTAKHSGRNNVKFYSSGNSYKSA